MSSPPVPIIDAPYLRTLRKAVDVAGGEAALAVALCVPAEKLRSWLAGERILPVELYISALQIVARAARPA
jgi:hypothetical protein